MDKNRELYENRARIKIKGVKKWQKYTVEDDRR